MIQPINSIQTHNKKYKPNYVKISGYSALLTGIGTITAATGHRFTMHKILGIISIISSFAHIGLIKFTTHKK